MKRFLTAMMALVVVATLNQCRKPDVESIDDVAKVRVSCTIPVNKDGKTDFTDISNGNVNWSAETERIYLAIPYDNNGIEHQIVELTSTSAEGGEELIFEGQVEQGLLQNGKHDIWYMGRSQNSKLLDDKVTGSIAEQSGSKDDLGYHHIAKASVNINVDNGITLTFEGNFKNQMAIAHLDLTNVAELSGEAIVGTDYSLEYSGGVYRLMVTGYNSINITGKENKNESYVVLFPTNEKDVELNSDSNKKITFHNGIKRNALYKENDNQPLIWELPEHECVDLGLPSGVKWATCNIGADAPEAYGNYYAWGEIEEPSPIAGYVQATCGTYNKRMNDISGHEIYDAAKAKWGEDWRIPTQAEYNELMNEEYCTWSWIKQNDVNGYLVTSKINGNYIFLPAAGYKNGSTVEIDEEGVYGTYSCSTPAERGNDDDAEKSYNLSFNDKTKAIAVIYRENGRPVRPVAGGNFEKPAAQYAEVITAEVSEITEHTAVCGGNVTVDKYSQVKERGVCWSTSQEPTIDDINDNKIECVQGEGEYTVTLTRLAPETVYYVRAYATTDAGTSYGIEVSFNTPKIGNNNYEYNFSNMGSHAVDLGLPSGVLWSDCNIGAEWAVEQAVWPHNIYGNYFMWACNTSSSSFGEGYYPEYAKECDFSYSGDVRYDAATNLWGGKWRTPTGADFEELMEYCNWEVITKDGINCLKFTSKHNGNSIYFPFAGCYNYAGDFIDLGEEGWYLISDKASSIYDDDDAPFKNLTSENNIRGVIWKVYIGSSVRPVIGPNPAGN